MRAAIAISTLGLLSTPLYLSFVHLASRGSPPPSLDPGSNLMIAYQYCFFPLFGLYLLAALAVFLDGGWQTPSLQQPPSNTQHPMTWWRPGSLWITLFFAILFRLILLTSPPVLSSDLYRYIWDGRVQAGGINPYRFPPEAPELRPLRDQAIYPYINRPWARTIYPPGAQLLFRTIYTIQPDSLLAIKGAMVLSDLATILLLIVLLRRFGLDPGRAILYAWHPLPIFEFAGSGHLDAFTLPFLLLAFLFRTERKDQQAGLALGAAALIKLYPALLLPALWRRGSLQLPLIFLGSLGLGYLTFLGAGSQILGFLPQYLSDPGETFNPGLALPLMELAQRLTGHPRVVMTLIAALTLLTLGFALTRKPVEAADAWIHRARLMLGAWLLLSATVHPWYPIPMIPLLALEPRPAWLYLTGAVTLSYLKYAQASQPMPTWVLMIEYGPFFLLLIGGTFKAMFLRGLESPNKRVPPWPLPL